MFIWKILQLRKLDFVLDVQTDGCNAPVIPLEASQEPWISFWGRGKLTNFSLFSLRITQTTTDNEWITQK